MALLIPVIGSDPAGGGLYYWLWVSDGTPAGTRGISMPNLGAPPDPFHALHC